MRPAELNSLSGALAVLTAMITPALLLSACGTFILSTSVRLGRVVDRIRILSEKYEQIVNGAGQVDFFEERRSMLFGQLDVMTIRARLLQRGLTVFYVSAGIFVFTSVAIGIISVFHSFITSRYSFIPVVLALAGAVTFFYGSVLLIFEARHALTSVRAETAFILKLAQEHSSDRVRMQLPPKPHPERPPSKPFL